MKKEGERFIETMKDIRSFLLFITFIASSGLTNGQEASSAKSPRLLFATTKTTTSTLTATTICWKPLTASATVVLACKKKKREFPGFSINDNPVSVLDTEDIKITKTYEEFEDDIKLAEEVPLIDGGKGDSLSGRDAKFLYYWATISETYTFTTFTSTAQLVSLVCTPPSFTHSLCTGFGR